MGLEFLERVRRTTVVSGLVIFAVIATYFGFPAGAGFIVGCAWCLVNLYFIGLFVEALLKKDRKSRLVTVALIKVPVLYAVGYALLSIRYLPTELVLAGFTWPLVVITLKAIGRFILKLDDTHRTSAPNYLAPDGHTTATAFSRGSRTTGN